MSTLVSGWNNTAQQTALVLATELETAPNYCNMTGEVHWDYGPYQVWQAPQCVAYLVDSEFVSAKTDEVWVMTNIVQRVMSRTCAVPASVGNLTLVDPVEAVTLVQLGGNCTMVTNSYLNEYVFNPESVMVTLLPTYSTSWMPAGAFTSITLMGLDGKSLGTSYVFDGSSIQVALSDLLLAAGVSLDDQNVDSGGKGLQSALQAAGSNTNSDTNWPTYRTTGVALRVKLRVANFRASAPVNFNATVQMFVENASPGTWTAAPTEVQYSGAGTTTFDGAPRMPAACMRRTRAADSLPRACSHCHPQRNGRSGGSRACTSCSPARASWARPRR